MFHGQNLQMSWDCPAKEAHQILLYWIISVRLLKERELLKGMWDSPPILYLLPQNSLQDLMSTKQKTGWTNHIDFQSRHSSSLVWYALVLFGKIVLPMAMISDAVNNHFLVYKAILAWWHLSNQQTDQVQPRASLLLTSEKAVFCKREILRDALVAKLSLTVTLITYQTAQDKDKD